MPNRNNILYSRGRHCFGHGCIGRNSVYKKDIALKGGDFTEQSRAGLQAFFIPVVVMGNCHQSFCMGIPKRGG